MISKLRWNLDPDMQRDWQRHRHRSGNPPLQLNMIRLNSTHLLLGLIATEVVFLTAEAFANRRTLRRPPGQRYRHPLSDEEDWEDSSAADAAHEARPSLHGNLQGLAGKLKDPAWAGMLAANEGNVALTEAERAVPMPNSAQFVQRLDKNPYVGQGMKPHNRHNP